ncbi:peptidoglycan-binding domain-containing protein [Streptomyces sp. NPDC052079]|uniref:peptidoglycan-binding domain-containing protein n=1 Tax=Streptomyces sp. NPDC052079 TaxID=3155526 RepID=UPI00341412D8
MTGSPPPTARRPGPTRRLADWLCSRPLVLAVFVIAALTMAASAYQNAQGRADSAPAPAPAATAPLDDCLTHDGCVAEAQDGLGVPEPAENTAANSPATLSPDSSSAPSSPDAATPHATGSPRTPGTSSRTWPHVKSGDQGETVAAIQLLLTSHGYRTAPDAVYGPATTSQVTVYQRDRSLADDGITGPDTWHALIVTVRAGDRGPAVTAVQRLLAAHGHPVSANGVFDEETAEAVTAFQTVRSLAPDGVVGPDTWSALVTLEQS